MTVYFCFFPLRGEGCTKPVLGTKQKRGAWIVPIEFRDLPVRSCPGFLVCDACLAMFHRALSLQPQTEDRISSPTGCTGVKSRSQLGLPALRIPARYRNRAGLLHIAVTDRTVYLPIEETLAAPVRRNIGCQAGDRGY